MTKYDIAEVLGVTKRFVDLLVVKSGEKYPNLIKKMRSGQRYSITTDFTVDEVMQILESYDWIMTPMMRAYIKENFIMHEGVLTHTKKRQIHLTKDIKDFLHDYKSKRKTPRVCVCCEYCHPRTRSTGHGMTIRPWCSFHEHFLISKYINVYKECCDAIVPIDRKEKSPYLYSLKCKIPSNLNAAMEIDNRTLGFDNDMFISKRNRKSDPVYILKDGTNYKEEDYYPPESVTSTDE